MELVERQGERSLQQVSLINLEKTAQTSEKAGWPFDSAEPVGTSTPRRSTKSTPDHINRRQLSRGAL